MNRRAAVTAFLALVPAAAACSGSVATSIRPASPTYADATKATSCAIVDGRNEPFVVDWPADRRADLEDALKHEVAVVHYSCDELRVLPDCHVAGKYNYAGVTEKEQVLKVEDADELRANFPLSGLKLAGRLAGDMSRGASLDVALAIAGKETALRGLVLTSDLKGECDGATHYVRSATLGAFAMATGTHAQLQSAAELFGASGSGASASTLHAENRDGRLEACRVTPTNPDVAIAGCGAPLRLELRPVRAAPPASRPEGRAPDETDVPVCPTGAMPGDNGTCISLTSKLPHVCAPTQLADCTAQCDAGSMSSCAILGRLYETGRGVPRDLARAVPLFDRACKGGATPACGRLGELLVQGGRRAEGLTLLTRSCSEGFADACVTALTLSAQDPHANKVDLLEKARRSCLSGKASSCAALAGAFRLGIGVRQNDGEAFHYSEIACEADAPGGCVLLAQAYAEGKGAPRDPAKALTINRTACDRGASESCDAASLAYFKGEGATKSAEEGVRYLTRACEGDARASCFTLGMRFQRGIDVPTDPARAVRYFTRACESGFGAACAAARAAQH